MLTHEFNPFWKFKIPSKKKKKSWRSAKTKESLELNWVEFCGWTCIFLGSKNFVRTLLHTCISFLLTTLSSSEESVFLVSCVLCVWPNYPVSGSNSGGGGGFFPREPPTFFFSSFVWLVCLPFCLLIGVIYSSRIYLSACADGGMSVAHGGHSSHYFFFLFFQCEPKGSIGRVVFISFSISSVQLVSFLFSLWVLSGRFDTAGWGIMPVKKRKLSGLLGLSFLDYFSCCSWLSSTDVA